MPSASQHNPRGEPPAARPGDDATPAADGADFFSTHSIQRGELPPSVKSAIEMIDTAKRAGIPLDPTQLEQIQRVLASQGEANHLLGDAVRARLREASGQSGH